ncbi:MAG: putative DNA repair protein RAD51 3 [Streblomastix strix]|uniref:DNA repair protein RAD51 homolog 3 n=1 Tax=Streblomastix strix TaxID=222440 RepID=A0A5J4WW82_9EUKA|nr:MAG: putative DNA repair protein RAD51 3 [Streblomastix strix]
MAQTSIANCGFSASQSNLLITHGFEKAKDLEDIGPSDLAKGHPPEQQQQGQSKGNSVVLLPQRVVPKSAWEIFQNSANAPVISTLCKDIDVLLGRGIESGCITEFCGSPGTGKTQMGMQLCLSVQQSEKIITKGGAVEAVYIDTEGSFMPDRVMSMASVFGDDDNKAEDLLSHIHIFRPFTYPQLLSTIKMLPNFISQHPNVKLIIVDSISAPLRHGFNKEMQRRSASVHELGATLLQIAKSGNGIAVVCTNQVTTKPFQHQPQQQETTQSPSQSDNTPSEGILVPALGDSWSQFVAYRIAFRMFVDFITRQPVRIATLMKGPNAFPSQQTAAYTQSQQYSQSTGSFTSVPFVISDRGVIDGQQSEQNSFQSNDQQENVDSLQIT